MTTTLIFDADGTLYDETMPKAKAELLTAQLIASRTGYGEGEVYNLFREVKGEITQSGSLSPDRNNRTVWYAETLRRMNTSHGDIVSKIDAREASGHYWEVVYGEIEPYFDLVYILPELQSRYRLAVLTDELYDIQVEKVKRLGLSGYFTEIISSEQAGVTKPDKRLFEYALNRLGVSAGESMMIGDNPSADIRGARSVGMRTAWLHRGKYYYYPTGENERADVVFENYLRLYDELR
ncbi:MAG TPA: HAD family hydrolase [Firmicutes bacterium]|nr:HAD family hydrolase [Bacillota bacterium]